MVVAKSRRARDQEFLGGASQPREASDAPGTGAVRSAGQLTDADVEIIATLAARKALDQFFVQVGVDTSDPFALQKDFMHLRNWREAIEQAKRRGMLTIVSTIVAGVLGLIYMLLTHK